MATGCNADSAKYGSKTAAMALRYDSVGIDDKALRSEEKLAVILGTEGDGLASQTIADCDYTVKIPMSHGVDSLNVAAASAVAFWELGHRKDITQEEMKNVIGKSRKISGRERLS